MGKQHNIAWKTSGRDRLRYGYDVTTPLTSGETDIYMSRELSSKMGQITVNASRVETQLLDLYVPLRDPALGHK